MGWEAYFETLFEKIDGKMLNEHKAKYQGKPLVQPYKRLKCLMADIFRIRRGEGRRS